MHDFIRIFFNAPLISAGVAWITAQLLKMLVCTIKDGKFHFVSVTASGGMPSSHAASVCAMATCVGRLEGFDSPVFAVAMIFCYIVCYDATGVRWETGEQAKILNRIMKNLDDGKPKENEKELKELVGHTPLQVFAGIAWGIAVGIVGSIVAVKLHYSFFV